MDSTSNDAKRVESSRNQAGANFGYQKEFISSGKTETVLVGSMSELKLNCKNR